MSVFTPASLLIALALNAPAFWSAFQNPSADLTGVLLHFVAAAIVIGLCLKGLRQVVLHYVSGGGRRLAPLAVEAIAMDETNER